MNLTEITRAMRKLRVSGMAATLETRIVQAQADHWPPLDFVSALVQDELHRICVEECEEDAHEEDACLCYCLCLCLWCRERRSAVTDVDLNVSLMSAGLWRHGHEDGGRAGGE